MSVELDDYDDHCHDEEDYNDEEGYYEDDNGYYDDEYDDDGDDGGNDEGESWLDENAGLISAVSVGVTTVGSAAAVIPAWLAVKVICSCIFNGNSGLLTFQCVLSVRLNIFKKNIHDK